MVSDYRRGEDHRFRRLLLHEPGADHAGWHGRGHRAVHLPRAGARQAGHAAIRHLFAGRRRVRGPVRASSVHRHHTGRHRRRTRQQSGAPAAGLRGCAACVQFVMSMLAKDPLDRPKDALAVSRTLSRIERRLLDQQTADGGHDGLAMPRRGSGISHRRAGHQNRNHISRARRRPTRRNREE